MASTSDHLLERVVHHLLKGDSLETRALIHDALQRGMDPFALFDEVLWPAAECTQQLRHSGLVTPRVFNHATRLLINLTSGLLPAVSSKPMTRRVFIISAPGEPSDTGAQLLASLAEARGFTALFAGARLTVEEICFAMPRLEVDAILMHGSVPESLRHAEKQIQELRTRGIWPDVQIAVAGALLRSDEEARGADLSACGPDEILELLMLCPDHRGKKSPAPAKCRQTPKDADLLFAYFPPNHRLN
jgi:methanogenic corrinoid protein MtbC1